MRNTIVKIVLAALCLMLFPQFQNAQNVEVKGNSKEFAGEELVVYQYADLITYQEKELVRFKVEANGDFKFNFFNDQINFIYIPLGIYKGYFFAEPGKSYEVILPERKDKTTAQILNPYFSEEYLHLGITGVDSTSLNYQIAIYDSRFNRELMFVMESLKEHKGQHVVDSSFSILEEQFKWSDIEYFNEYKSGKLAFFKFISSQMRAKKVAKDQISNHPVLFANTAYMELFNQVFKNYFMYHVRTKDGKQLAIDVATKDYQGLKKTLNQNPLIKNDTIKELVILKSLYDEFYADNFSRASMLALLDSLYFNSKVPENQLIAQNIRQQVTHLLHGFYPHPEHEMFRE